MISRNIPILGLCQIIHVSGTSTFVLLGGIIGSEIAPTPAWATLPVTFSVAGNALGTIPAALLMRRIGRRLGFAAAAAASVVASLLAVLAVAEGNFALFCLAAVMIGLNGAFVQQYRFAASESVDSAQSARAVSFVLVGGIVAGFLGPEVARRTRDLLPAIPYAGSFLSLAVLYFIATLLLLTFFRNTRIQAQTVQGVERPLRVISGQPLFRLAVFSAAVGYGVMSFIMTATPLHLTGHAGFSIDEAAMVVQSHIIAMYLPSLFTGWLMERLGMTRVLLLGVFAMLICVTIAMISIHLMHFWLALVLLGVGWNFLFVGGTVLLTRTYLPAERFKAQATNDFVVFASQALSSASAGTILHLAGWPALGVTSLLPLLITLFAIISLRRQITLAPAAASA
ncbi:MAG: MFS transporter [Chloroflexota bacterium]|nr:MAG: MFS transporter [Chloroflexota bacterium]